MEESFLSSAKVEKVDTKVEGYEEALGENFIPTNQGLDTSIKKGNEFKNHKSRLGPYKSEFKDKKREKEKLREKPDQKYEPPHQRKTKEEVCMAWMSKINWVPSTANGHVKDSNLKEAPS